MEICFSVFTDISIRSNKDQLLSFGAIQFCHHTGPHSRILLKPMLGDLDKASIFFGDVEFVVADSSSNVGSNQTHNVLDTITVDITIDTVMTINSIITI
jgi:hypothetical protein